MACFIIKTLSTITALRAAPKVHFGTTVSTMLNPLQTRYLLRTQTMYASYHTTGTISYCYRGSRIRGSHWRLY